MTMKLEIIKWNDLTEDEKITSIQRPTLNSLKGQDSTITQIFKDVRADGDEALKKFTSIYDGVKIDDFLMSEKEIDSAFSRVPRDLIQSIENAIENVKTFHEKNFENDLNPSKVDASEEVLRAVVLFAEFTRNPVIFPDNLEYFLSL